MERNPDRVVVIASGGVDSSTLIAWYAVRYGAQVTALSFNYGQRHLRELGAANRIAEHFNAEHRVVHMPEFASLIAGSALTDDTVDVPDGHYTDASMRVTVVPNRNAVMLSIAFALGSAIGATVVAFGAHAGDHAIYPDCRREFVTAYQRMVDASLEGFNTPVLTAPFLGFSKTDIVRLGDELGVPFAETYSCYRGHPQHCGTCATCGERREAFALAGVVDPTDYALPKEVTS